MVLPEFGSASIANRLFGLHGKTARLLEICSHRGGQYIITTPSARPAAYPAHVSQVLTRLPTFIPGCAPAGTKSALTGHRVRAVGAPRPTAGPASPSASTGSSSTTATGDGPV